MNGIRTVIFDWAGTTVDFGSFAPVKAFQRAFEQFGISVSIEEIRAPMGMQKKAHIQEILKGDRVSALWKERRRKAHTQEDIDRIYRCFEGELFETLARHALPLPGVVPCVETLRSRGIKIGSTTGYGRAMMDVIEPLSRRKGYAPDCLVCPDDTGGLGRPHPYMLWRNLERLRTPSITEVLKAGDTGADMREARNAGALGVGIIQGSNMLGLCEEESAALTEEERAARFKEAEERFVAAGADFVIADITGLPALIERINTMRKEN